MFERCDIGAFEYIRPAATFTTSAGAIFFSAVPEDILPTAGRPAGVSFPYGFFAWTVTDLTPGQTIDVTITFPTDIPIGAQYWKVIRGQWTDVTSLLGDDDGDNVLTLKITDGGTGDEDGKVNGRITDPGGIGTAGESSDATPPEIT